MFYFLLLTFCAFVLWYRFIKLQAALLYIASSFIYEYLKCVAEN